MMTARFEMEFITSAMLGGALPKGYGSKAELREPQIRGQLRWWFRALGGTKDREDYLFGSVAGENGGASKIRVRIVSFESGGKAGLSKRVFSPPQTAAGMGIENINSGSGYLAFPLRNPEDARAVIPARTRFGLELASARLARESFYEICNIVRIFAKYGALGFRSRRTFGALRMTGESGDLPPQTLDLSSYPECSYKTQTLHGHDFPNERAMRNAAGQWLRLHRNNSEIIKKELRGIYFGHSGQDGPKGEKRRASPIILRPMLAESGNYILCILYPTRQLQPSFQKVISA